MSTPNAQLPARGSTGGGQSQKQPQGRGDSKDSLAAVLTFSERSDLVNLVETITSTIINVIGATFETKFLIDATEDHAPEGASKSLSIPEPEIQELRRSTLRWYEKWREAVLRRVCEAANTHWEPLARRKQDAPAKSWDELSLDDEPQDLKKAIDSHTPDAELQALYPPIQTPLSENDREKRLLLLHSMLLLIISLKHYYAPSRILLLRLASSLDLTMDDLDKDEEKTAASLVSGAKALSANEEVEKAKKENRSSRSWKVIGASIAGAAVIGLTGGLAAPLVAAGIGTVMGGLGLGATAAAGLLGSVAGSSVLVGGLFGAYGARMTGKMMDKYAREVSDFAFIPLRSQNQPSGEDVKEVDPADRRLRVTIGVSGWLNEKADVTFPWRVLGSGAEVFALRWELEALMKLGTGLRDMVTSTAWNYAKIEVLKMTVFRTLLGAVALPLGLLQLGNLVDNPFRVTKTRADKAGEVLADAIINRAQGERPVNLIGYSLGARLIQSCLLSLAKRKAFGLVESVVLCGAPVPSSAPAWYMIRSVAAGRVINVYSENDYVLGFLYRANSAQVGVAGLQKIDVKNVENKDVSDIVTSHFQYRYLLGRILKEVGWKDLDEVELQRESEALRLLQEQERKIVEILEDEESNKEEKERLREMMETKAPVQEGPAPQLPPRRPTGRERDSSPPFLEDVASGQHLPTYEEATEQHEEATEKPDKQPMRTFQQPFTKTTRTRTRTRARDWNTAYKWWTTTKQRSPRFSQDPHGARF